MRDLEYCVNNPNPEFFSQAKLDKCVEKFSKLFTTSAKTIFGIKRSRNIREKMSKVSVSKKPWLRLDCKYA